MASNAKPAYRPEIDGLRAVAVLAVVIHHFEKALLPSGFLGVDVFFVISGFVISGSVASRRGESAKEFLLGFYSRRVKRLVPALSLCVALSAPIICLLNFNPAASLKTGAAAVFGTSNVFLFFEHTDYFGGRAELNIFTQTWSLGVEEQFYFVFPLMAWLLWLSNASTKGSNRRFTVVVACLCAASFVSFISLWSRNMPLTYFMMGTRFWELGAGVLVFLASRQTQSRGSTFLPPTALGAILLSFFLPIDFGFVSVPIAVFATALLLFSIRANGTIYQLLTFRIMLKIGVISYSLYLWHWVVLCIARWTVGVSLLSTPVLFILIIVLAEISFQKVEKPLRKRHWASTDAKTILVAVGVMLAVSGGIAVLYKPLRGQLYLGKIFNVQLPANVTTFWKDPKTGTGRDPCMVHREFDKSLVSTCLVTPKTPRQKAYVIGDSHARNYLFAVKKALPKTDVRHLTMGRGCAFIPESMMSFKNAFGVGCVEYVEDVAAAISTNIRPGDFVFVGQRLFEFDSKRQTAEYFDFLRIFSDKVIERGATFVLFDGVLPPAKYPNDCIRLPWRPFQGEKSKGCFISRETVLNQFQQFDERAARLAADAPKKYYAPLRVGLCVSDTCGQRTANGTSIWHDRGHITEATSAELAPLLEKKLKDAAEEIPRHTGNAIETAP